MSLEKIWEDCESDDPEPEDLPAEVFQILYVHLEGNMLGNGEDGELSHQ